ncbi:hypothetical protein, partial [Enterococcus larvae]|uniref:hypothetical protein n=1 Tax=Enterococcus larvae TaxID=2794352 RepID=UPI003F41779B
CSLAISNSKDNSSFVQTTHDESLLKTKKLNDSIRGLALCFLAGDVAATFRLLIGQIAHVLQMTSRRGRSHSVLRSGSSLERELMFSSSPSTGKPLLITFYDPPMLPDRRTDKLKLFVTNQMVTKNIKSL